MVTALLARIHRRLAAVGYHTRQLRSQLDPDLSPESLMEAIVELHEHIEGEDARCDARHPAPSSSLTNDLGRRLGAFARDANGLTVPARAHGCSQAAHALEGRGDLTYDVLLVALESLLGEAQDRARIQADQREQIEAMQDTLSDLDAQIDHMRRDLRDMLGVAAEDADDEEQWDGLLERVREWVAPPLCPVPGCTEQAIPSRHPPHVVGPWPVALCQSHTVARFEALREAVMSFRPDYTGAIHSAFVPLPEFAHLAPSPEALRDPPRRTRMQRIVPEEK